MLLEAERVGYGASGRSGGQIIPGYSCSMAKLVDQLGMADAQRLWDFSVEGVELTRNLIERNRIDCDLAWGHMHVAIKPRQRDELPRIAARAGGTTTATASCVSSSATN